ncbi:MAG: leucine--tRNA ligase [Peptoniphilus sp.]|nr:leucine--tRNA ligase [Peptoniphilus sp.]MDD7363141.1 leucine--tRNA ligase [Bacillota bacterium]MDY6044337.1 leucine--tRNA ligase [Peptoniphilus sp.]
MKAYDPKQIEKKWQDFWDEHETYKTVIEPDKKKFYPLVEFPYPSGQGLHVGHPRPYTALDIVARKRRYEGENVIFAMGWDAFGLPTENYAIKNKIHPRIVTERNIANFKKQLKSLGFSFDWSREINTTDPKYYKWTQWIFLQMFKHGLAYKEEMPINWCPSCKIGLANEEVVGGKCERCGSDVQHRRRSQWMLRITKYAERLLEGLNHVDFIEPVKIQQRNWIGKSVGAEIDFKVKDTETVLHVFTTRPDTLFGATYMVLAPEHPVVEGYRDSIRNMDEVDAYLKEVEKKSDFERAELLKEKTGVELKGLKGINPATGEEIPIWISDYVLMSYGTGAIMSVPGHDQRDWEFAKKFDLPIVPVIEGGDVEKEAYTDVATGTMINSDFLNGMSVQEATKTMIEWLGERGLGHEKTNYKLRDWVFSRQRYWGEPIPLVHCDHCGWVPVPEEELPLELPDVENYEPTDDGKSPLSNVEDWVNTTCPECGRPAKRETDTMPQWAGSSWYYLRYIDPDNDEALASKEALEYFMPVDWYNGGMEHTTLHLLYSRFWHKFLYDIGVVNTDEPYQKRTSHGMILGENGAKMSKSRGNVINPDDIVDQYGADTLRTYEMFIGDFEKSAPWSDNGVKGCRRFLERVWNLAENLKDGDNYREESEILMHQTIKKVSYDYEHLKANTAIAQLMTAVNHFQKVGVNKAEFKSFLILLNPVAPHITEELWEMCDLGGYLNEQTWPDYDEEKTVEDVVELPVQFNGKVRFKVVIPRDASRDEAIRAMHEHEDFERQIDGKNVVKEIYVPGKILNVVIK